MGLETWYYSPPLPPYHEIQPEFTAARDLFMSADSKVDGVEAYGRHAWSPDEDRGESYHRGRFVKMANGDGGSRLSFVYRHHRGGTASMALDVCQAIPAELVDAGVLGPEFALDHDSPGECAACLSPIPRHAPTGRCTDKVACKARIAAREDARLAAEWAAEMAKIEHPSPYQALYLSCELLDWANRKIRK